MPQPHSGQQWTHGWVPVTATAAKSKNHGRKPGAGSLLARVVAEAAEIHKRMQEGDAKRGAKKDHTPDVSTGVAVKVTGHEPVKAVGAPQKPSPKTTPKTGTKVGVDSIGKPLRVGDEVRITGGEGQGKTGRVVSKGRGRTVRVRTDDGSEIDVHDINVRNKADHDASRHADAAIRNAARRSPPTAASPTKRRQDDRHAGAPQFVPDRQPVAVRNVKPLDADATIPDIQNKVREVYDKLVNKRGDYASLFDVRANLGDKVPRERVDAALRSMIRLPGVTLIPETNQKTLTRKERQSAVHVGDQDKHLINIWPT